MNTLYVQGILYDTSYNTQTQSCLIENYMLYALPMYIYNYESMPCVALVCVRLQTYINSYHSWSKTRNDANSSSKYLC